MLAHGTPLKARPFHMELDGQPVRIGHERSQGITSACDIPQNWRDLFSNRVADSVEW